MPNGLGIFINEMGNLKEGEFINGTCDNSTHRFTYYDGLNAK